MIVPLCIRFATPNFVESPCPPDHFFRSKSRLHTFGEIKVGYPPYLLNRLPLPQEEEVWVWFANSTATFLQFQHPSHATSISSFLILSLLFPSILVGDVKHLTRSLHGKIGIMSDLA